MAVNVGHRYESNDKLSANLHMYVADILQKEYFYYEKHAFTQYISEKMCF